MYRIRTKDATPASSTATTDVTNRGFNHKHFVCWPCHSKESFLKCSFKWSATRARLCLDLFLFLVTLPSSTALSLSFGFLGFLQERGFGPLGPFLFRFFLCCFSPSNNCSFIAAKAPCSVCILSVAARAALFFDFSEGASSTIVCPSMNNKGIPALLRTFSLSNRSWNWDKGFNCAVFLRKSTSIKKNFSSGRSIPSDASEFTIGLAQREMAHLGGDEVFLAVSFLECDSFQAFCRVDGFAVGTVSDVVLPQNLEWTVQKRSYNIDRTR